MKTLFIYLLVIFGLLTPNQDIEFEPFIELTPEETVEMLESGTGILYFTSDTCPWCAAISPVLEEVARENKTSIYICNPREISDIDGKREGTEEYKRMLELLDKYLRDYTDKDGNYLGKKHIYMPDVYVIIDGEVKDHKIGVSKTYTDKNREMTKEEKNEIKEIYQGFIDIIK